LPESQRVGRRGQWVFFPNVSAYIGGADPQLQRFRPADHRWKLFEAILDSLSLARWPHLNPIVTCVPFGRHGFR
jgi:hypothetical protein